MRKIVIGLFLLTTTSMSAWADNKKPSTVNGVSANAISDSAVRVSWNKPWDNVGVLGYNIYRNGAYFTTVFNTYFVDNNVSKNKEYRYGIVAFDKAKNFNSVSKEARVTVGGSNKSGNPAPPPPAAKDGRVNSPQGLYAEIENGNRAKIKWQVPNGNIRGYNVYINERYQTTVSSPEYNANNLTWGEDYQFRIVAFNQAKRFSLRSDILTVNTANGSSRAPTSKNEQPQNDGNNNNDGRYRWGPDHVINGERQYYVDRINNPDFGHSPFEFDGKHLTITAIKTPEHLRASANWQKYLSGALTTFNKFEMKYGYVEMRAKLPKGKGLWPAFWLLHKENNGKRPEIDVMEYIGDQPNKVYHTYHWLENWNPRRSPNGMSASGPDYSQGFHTYAVKWDPGKITWYVDGKEYSSFSNGNVSSENMYLLVNLAVGGSWPGDPNGNTQFPARMKIDYIRAYKRK